MADPRVFKSVARATIHIESFQVDGQTMICAGDGKRLLTWEEVEFIFQGLKDGYDYLKGQQQLFNGDTGTEGDCASH